MYIEIDNEKYNVIVKYKRNVKYINLKVKNKTIYVTSYRAITKDELSYLLYKNLNNLKKLIKKAPINPIKDDEFLLFGKIYKLNLGYHEFEITDDAIFSPDLETIYKYGFYEVSKRFNWYQKNSFSDTPSTLIFKQMKTRWGVCYFKKAKISLTKAIIHLPKEIIDYVIVHEFCHFVYPNHSKDFYNYVSKFCPDYKIRRKEIKTYAYVL